MNVLSLFDGISCGRVALERAGIHVDNYFASEIDKYAIQISKKNYPDIIQLGDVYSIDYTQLPKIDLVIGGSPCTYWSIAKKIRETTSEGIGFDLFMQYVRAVKETGCKWFLYENNFSIHKDIKKEISKKLGVPHVTINSSVVSAQSRKRCYWTNIRINSMPKDKNITLKEVLLDLPFRELKPFAYNKSCFGMSGMKSVADLKSNTLTTKNGHSRMYLLNDQKTMFRNLDILEYERLQTLPDNYTSGISNTQRYKCIGNGWTVDVISHILSFIKEEK